MESISHCCPERSWRRWAKPVVLVLALGLIVRGSVGDLGRVAGGSMRPTLLDGDRILTNQLAYGLRLPFTNVWPIRWAGPQRGDVVVLYSPVDGKRLVKRIVAVPGDPLEKDCPTEAMVPPGMYFVRGDAADSFDSRTFGCVPRERILGRVVGVAFSVDAARCRPRWERFFQGKPSTNRHEGG
jgi:signal peptidase I